MGYRQKEGEFWKIQEISFPMSIKTPYFCEKNAEKNKVKHAYPPLKKWHYMGPPIDSSFAHISKLDNNVCL